MRSRIRFLYVMSRWTQELFKTLKLSDTYSSRMHVSKHSALQIQWQHWLKGSNGTSRYLQTEKYSPIWRAPRQLHSRLGCKKGAKHDFQIQILTRSVGPTGHCRNPKCSKSPKWNYEKSFKTLLIVAFAQRPLWIRYEQNLPMNMHSDY